MVAGRDRVMNKTQIPAPKEVTAKRCINSGLRGYKRDDETLKDNKFGALVPNFSVQILMDKGIKQCY